LMPTLMGIPSSEDDSLTAARYLDLQRRERARRGREWNLES
jgi:hypothetical protein